MLEGKSQNSASCQDGVSSNLITFRHQNVARKHDMFNELGPVSAICSFLCETGRNGHTFAYISGIAHNLLKLVMETVRFVT